MTKKKFLNENVEEKRCFGTFYFYWHIEVCTNYNFGSPNLSKVVLDDMLHADFQHFITFDSSIVNIFASKCVKMCLLQ